MAASQARWRVGVVVSAQSRHLCPLCGALIVHAHFKRHLMKHDREGIYAKSTIDRAWLAFLDETGWPSNLTPAGALLRSPSRSAQHG